MRHNKKTFSCFCFYSVAPCFMASLPLHVTPSPAYPYGQGPELLFNEDEEALRGLATVAPGLLLLSGDRLGKVGDDENEEKVVRIISLPEFSLLLAATLA